MYLMINMKRIILITILIVFFILLSSYADSIKINTNSENINQKKWTFILYFDADHSGYSNIESQMKRSLNFLNHTLYSYDYNPDISVLVQYDTYYEFEGINRYEQTESGLELVESLEELSMGDKDTLVNFIDWAVQRSNSERYCLVLADHGVGWRNGFLRDEDDYLSMQELKDSLNEIKTNILGGNKIDLLVMDACQMSMMEVYYQIKGTTKICLSPPEAYSGMYPYHMIFSDLNLDLEENNECDEIGLVNHFYDNFMSFHNSYHGYLSAYNVDKICNQVKESIDRFAKELINNFEDYKDEIKDAIVNTKIYNGPNEYILHYRDLYNFTEKILESEIYEAIKEKALELREELNDSKIIPSKKYGLSIYLPIKDRDYPYESSYSDLEFSKDTTWDDFVLKTKNLRSVKNKSVTFYQFNFLTKLISKFIKFDLN